MNVERIPPDLAQCQALHRAAYSPFRFGPAPPFVRCTHAPSVVVTETGTPDDGGPQGSMSLCAECLIIAVDKLGPDAFTVEPIACDAARGG
jgi:hypothetical protein